MHMHNTLNSNKMHIFPCIMRWNLHLLGLWITIVSCICPGFTIGPGLAKFHPRFQTREETYAPAWDPSVLSYTKEADSYAYWNCHTIPPNMTLCKSVGYSRMVLPNFLEHESLREVIQQANVWVSLVNTDCHPDIQRFLCSLYAPICLKSHQEAKIPPCWELCDQVRNACLPRMRLFGFEWPEIVHCNKFPKLAESMCIPPQQNKPVACAPCEQAITVENIASSYCMADVVMRASIKDLVPQTNMASLSLILSPKTIALKLAKRDGTVTTSNEFNHLRKHNRQRRHQLRKHKSRRYRHTSTLLTSNHPTPRYLSELNSWNSPLSSRARRSGMQTYGQQQIIHPMEQRRNLNNTSIAMREQSSSFGRKRRTRNLRLHDLDGITELLLGCSACSSLLSLSQQSGGSTLFSKRWLVMGRRIRDPVTSNFNHQIQVTFLTHWDRKSFEFRKSLKAIRNQPESTLCPKQQQTLVSPSNVPAKTVVRNFVAQNNLKILRSVPSELSDSPTDMNSQLSSRQNLVSTKQYGGFNPHESNKFAHASQIYAPRTPFKKDSVQVAESQPVSNFNAPYRSSHLPPPIEQTRQFNQKKTSDRHRRQRKLRRLERKRKRKLQQANYEKPGTRFSTSYRSLRNPYANEYPARNTRSYWAP